MIVFQYKMNIFYRASRDIHPGEELLVWYGSSEYSLAHGVPTGIEEILGEDSPRIAGKKGGPPEGGGGGGGEGTSSRLHVF